MAKIVQFTQYLMPDGEQKPVETEMPDEVAALAERVTSDPRYRFECEMLTTDMVSLTCADKQLGDDIAIEVVANGPLVPEAAARLIRSAHRRIYGTEVVPSAETGTEAGNVDTH